MARTFILILIFATVVFFSFLPAAHAQITAKYRWDSRNFNVYVDRSCSQQWRNLIESGFKMWQSGFQFTYQYVGSSTLQSDTAYFYCDGATPTWDNRGCDDETSWTVKTGTSNILNQTLTSLCALGSLVFSVPWAAQHEIGHALGLEHSTTVRDLMSGSRDGIMRNTTPSQEDFTALNETYAIPIPEFSTGGFSLLVSLMVVCLITLGAGGSAKYSKANLTHS